VLLAAFILGLHVAGEVLALQVGSVGGVAAFNEGDDVAGGG
jgi:hypothetical protein